MPLVSVSDLLTLKNTLLQTTEQLQQKAEYDALLARATGFAEEYDRFILLGPEEPSERRPGIHASEISGCKRRIVYSLLATPRKESLSKNWRQRFQVGHAIHRMLQDDFHEMARRSGGLLRFEDEVRIAPERQPLAERWFINSSCDGVFTFFDKPGGKPILRMALEIKTESPDGYAKLTKPKPEHIDQAHIYMKVLDVPLTWFLYMNKGNQNNTDTQGPFLVHFDEKVWGRLEFLFAECFGYADRGEIPKREESIGCQFCSFAYTCQPPSLTNGGNTETQHVRSFRR